jgi:5-methylcytosine-specific restriction protein A
MRQVEEWIAKNDNEAIPPRVQLRVFGNGGCRKCGRQLRPGHWSCDHIVALINGGQHRESNLQALCNSPCHSDKTKADVAEKADVYAKKRKHIGVKKRGGRKIRSRGFERRVYYR